ncbi:PilZ domain-containing protein [Sphingomonas sp. R647]|uniref:PilZ domain-containing protein n=1 Tax=Sphingomonas sp. R647 TaxID=2875233 RepID=UPI001CD6931A|nr:PilZ domain-containing protein [Sphingomonas sp. R647]MCA1196715.1 PilZ domain-containing protein [Sphingomonas sp. R647]
MVSTGKRSFTAEFEPAVLGRRRAPRAPVSLDAKVGRGGLDRALCKVVDLSTNGAKIETYSAIRRDSIIWLTLPHVGHWAARVVWSNDFEAGLEFQIPLSEDEFEMLAA